MFKFIKNLALTLLIFISTINQVKANNLLVKIGSIFTVIQLNHNHHVAGMNKNLYNSGQMGYLKYNGKWIYCSHLYAGPNIICYERDGYKWNFIPNH